MTVIHNIEKSFSQYLFTYWPVVCDIQELSHLPCWERQK